MVLLAHPEKTAERHHRIDRATADLVDHDVINAAELFPSGIIDIGALHLVGRDEGPGGNRSGFGHGQAPLRYRDLARSRTGETRLAGDALSERFTKTCATI